MQKNNLREAKLQKFLVKPQKNKKIAGILTVQGDKSITHRAFMLASICDGKSLVKNPLRSEDCLNTLQAVNLLGARFETQDSDVVINGIGLKNFKTPEKEIYLGNSGTGTRLLSGLVAGQNGLETIITGDKSLSNRPMDRIMNPLSEMGAKIEARNSRFLPLKIHGQNLKGISYTLKIASAQIKSCLLLAGLFASGKTEILEPTKSRNHTENMLKFLGIDLKIADKKIILTPPSEKIKAREFFVPGDISSAAFFIVLGLLASDDGILIKNVGLNPTRTGIINVLQRMGGFIEIQNSREISGEKIGDIFVKKSDLKGTLISGDEIPNLIDEIPIISVAASFAKGETKISDAKELRYKESDRIKTVKNEFSKLGAEIEELEDGLIIRGMKKIQETNIKVSSHYDHRIAMSLIIFAMANSLEIEIDDVSCINTSFPSFFECLEKIIK